MNQELDGIFRLCAGQIEKSKADLGRCVAVLREEASGQSTLEIADRIALQSLLNMSIAEPKALHMCIFICNKSGEGVFLEVPYERYRQAIDLQGTESK